MTSYMIITRVLKKINNLSDFNKIELIKTELRKQDLDTYKEWEDSDFNIDHMFGGNVTLLHLAVEHGYKNVVDVLVQEGADLDIKDTQGQTPFHKAASSCNYGMVKYLTEKGANFMARDNQDRTPLHLAAENDGLRGRFDVVKYLVYIGADLMARDKQGETPLDYAFHDNMCNLDLAEYLIKKGASINTKDNNGKTSISKVFESCTHESLKRAEGHNHHGIAPKNLWMNISSSTKPPTLLTSRMHDSTDVQKMSTAVVNNTIILSVLATGLFNKTKYKQSVHESLLSPIKQLMKSTDNSSKFLEESLRKGEEEGWGSPSTDMNEVKISGNETGMWK